MIENPLLLAREELACQTPLRDDCGRLCGCACCQGDEGEGMYLFPGEETLYQNASWASIAPSQWLIAGRPVPLLSCEGICPREERPLACRLFPLTLSMKKGGEGFRVIQDPRAWAHCPLAPHGLAGLSRDFVQAVENAFAILWKNPEQRRFLEALDAMLRELQSFG